MFRRATHWTSGADEIRVTVHQLQSSLNEAPAANLEEEPSFS